MASIRFTSLTSRMVGRVFSLGTAGCLIALSGLGSAQDARPDWSTWKGVPMEPIFVWELYHRQAKAPVETSEEPQVKSPQDEVPAPEEAAPVATDDATVEATPASAPQPTPWDALDLGLFRRATAAVPAGIPVSRAAERLAEAELARTELAAELTGPNRELWIEYLRGELQFHMGDPKRWAHTADLVVSLELFEFAPLLATALDQPENTYVRQAAWASLFELFGMPLKTAAEWQAFVDGSTAGPYEPAAHAALREQAELSRARQLELFTYHLDDAVAHLDDVDPKVRAGCASVLREALLAGTVDSESTLDALLTRLEIERRPAVVDALLEAMFTMLEDRGAEDSRVARLRSILAQAAQSTAPSAELLIARSLARLPWPASEPQAPDSLESGAGLLTAILRSVAEVEDTASGAETPPPADLRDADILLGVLKALDRVCRGVGEYSETSKRLSANVDRSPLLKLVLGNEFDLGVREIAAGTLPRVAPPEDVAVLIDVLGDKNTDLTSDLRYALLGAVGHFVERDDAAPEYTAPVMSCLLEHTGRSEQHMRERALGLLLSDALSAEISGEQVMLFLARLDVEQAPSLQDTLLLLIERYGDESMLKHVLELKTFDSLVARGPASEKAMLDLVSKLAGTDPTARFTAAQRLYATVDPGVQISPGIRALSLMAELPTESLIILEPMQHREIAKWAVELRVFGVNLAKDIPQGVDLLDHLVNLHVPSSGAGDSYSQAEKDFMQAQFLSDIAATKSNGEAKAMESEVLAKFASALEQAPDHQLKNFSMVVRHARARFRSKPDTVGLAFVDYSIIFTSPERMLLDPGDLRSAASAALAQAAVRAESAAVAAGTSPAAIPESSKVPTAGDQLAAFEFSHALVSHDSWHREPESVRFDDLRNLATAAAASGDRLAVGAVHGLLTDLPKLATDSQLPGENSDATNLRPWSGLDASPDRLAELNRLHTVIQNELARLTVQDKTPEDVDLASEPEVDPPKPVDETPGETGGTSGNSGETPVDKGAGTEGTTPIVPRASFG